MRPLPAAGSALRRALTHRWVVPVSTAVTLTATVASSVAAVHPPVNPYAGGLSFYLVGVGIPALVLLVAGLVLHRRHPDNPLGRLLLLDSVAQHLYMLVVVPVPLITTTGLLLQDLSVAVTAHIALAWPSGRLLRRVDRVVVGLFYVGAILARVLTSGLDEDLVGDLFYPSPLLAVEDQVVLVVNLLILPLFLVWLLRVIRRWQATTGASRRLMRPVLYGAPVFTFIYTVGYPILNLGSPSVLSTIVLHQVVWLLGYGVLPTAFLVGALQLRLTREAVVSSLVDIGGLPTLDRLEQRLRQQLADPELCVLRYSPATGGYVDRDGHGRDLPARDAPVTATVLEKEGRPLAAVVHDAALLYDPALHATVYRAVRLTLETVELRDELRARGGDSAGLPDGDVTFLFGDVEGSTGLLERAPGRYADLLDEMRQLLVSAVEEANGRVVDARGDEVFAAFPEPRAGIGAAVGFQRRLGAVSWPDGLELRVRVGLHRGHPERTRSGYVGMDVHIAARVMAAGHGGQILVSSSMFDAVDGPADVTVRVLGSFALAGIAHPVAIGQVEGAGLAADFPVLRARPAGAGAGGNSRRTDR